MKLSMWKAVLLLMTLTLSSGLGSSTLPSDEPLFDSYAELARAKLLEKLGEERSRALVLFSVQIEKLYKNETSIVLRKVVFVDPMSEKVIDPLSAEHQDVVQNYRKLKKSGSAEIVSEAGFNEALYKYETYTVIPFMEVAGAPVKGEIVLSYRVQP